MPFSSMNALIPLCAGSRIGLREHERVVGDGRVRDPVLLAVEDVDVALAPRGRAHRGDVGAGARLGQAEAGELLALRLGTEPALLLLLRAVAQERQRVEPDVHRDQRPERGLAALDLLAGECLRDEVEPRAAVLLGDRRSRAGRARPCPRSAPVSRLMVDVVLDGDGQDALVDEAPDSLLIGRCSSLRSKSTGPSLLPRLRQPSRPCNRVLTEF